MGKKRRRPRLILVEGPDGAGKTTLIDSLSKLLPEEPYVGVCGVPEGPPRREYLTKAVEAWYEMKWVVMFDRFHLGEQVYGPIMRGQDALGDVGRRVVEHFLNEIYEPVVVLARPPFEACVDAWAQRLDREYVPDLDRMQLVWEAYGELKTDLPVVQYNRTKDTVERLAKKVFV